MLKSTKNKIHPSLQVSIHVVAYWILLAVIMMFTVGIGETLVNIDLGNTDINAITYIY